MTSLTPSPLLVALVQAAASLPIFIFALPAGAIADIIDRRRLLMVTQTWMLFAASLAAGLTLLRLMSPLLLLTTAFLMGLGEALNAPAWLAITPETVPGEHLRAAVTLNGAGFNVSRAVGPALAGLVISISSPGAAFALNAFSFLGVIIVLYTWRRPAEKSSLPPENISSAIRLGLNYVIHTSVLRAVFVRASIFIFCASAIVALLPVFARNVLQLGALGYGILLAFFGAGAVTGAGLLPKVTRRLSLNHLAVGATVLFAIVSFAITAVPLFLLDCLALFVAGVGWLTLLASFMTLVQVSCPSWIRGRVLAVYLLMFSGSLVVGSGIWGEVADILGVSQAWQIATLGLFIGLVAAVRFRLPDEYAIDLTPSSHWPTIDISQVSSSELSRPAFVLIEYRINAAKSEDFLRAMGELRKSRIRTGSTYWDLLRDVEEPTRYVEIFRSPSWIDHQRQHERLTVADKAIEEKAISFSKTPESLPVSHLISVDLTTVAVAKESKEGGRASEYRTN